MSTIRRLSKQLASQIAAGEVVERPASVVKELLENAVDAHGTHILCEIKEAGKLLIRVRDNGTGIVKDELPLALAPHATSKIYSSDDLNSITTLGFRGEALASIASVSKLTLTSKTKDEDNAYCVKVEGPEQEPLIAPAAHPDGTTVDVCELFFNTPARRRFLKSDRTEFLRIKDTFIRIALAHPDTGFELVNEGKTVFKVSKSSLNEGIDLKRIAILLGSDFSQEGIKVLCEDPNLKMEGMLLPPPSVEQSVSEQVYLFLNGRPIADKVVTHALKEAFFEVLGRTLPIRCVLYLEVKPDEVDVNVHPRKDEVRFHEPSLIHDLITDALVLALRKANIGPHSVGQSELDFATDKAPIVGYVNANKTESPHAASFDINNEALPAFPTGVSSFFNGASVNTPKGSGSISSSSGSSGGSVSSNRVSAGNYHSTFSNQNTLQRNINVYKSAVNASNVGVNANVNLNEPGIEQRVYSNPIGSAVSGVAPTAFVNAPNSNLENGFVPNGSENTENNIASNLLPNGILFLDLTDRNVALIKLSKKYYLISLKKLKSIKVALEYQNSVKKASVLKQRLLMPFSFTVDPSLAKSLKYCTIALGRLGFGVKIFRNRIELTEIPALLKGIDLASVSKKIFLIVCAEFRTIEEGKCPQKLSSIVGYESPKSSEILENEAKGLLSILDKDNPLKDLEGSYLELNLKKLSEKLGAELEE